MTEQPIATLSGIARRVVRDPKTEETREYYVGVIRSDLIKALSFVPVKEQSTRTFLQEQLPDGYQRPGSALRMRKFGEFVGDNPLSVVPPVVLSGRGAWRFTGKSDYGQLEIYSPAAIVDGQHRVGGYVWLHESDGHPRSVDFILLPELSLQEEIDEFLSINDTQKGVPKSLNVLLEGSPAALVGVELDELEHSPFYDRITQVKKTKGDLFTLAAVKTNVVRTFSHGAFQDVGIDEQLDIMIQYWEIIADAFPEEWEDMNRDKAVYKLLETTGLIAWSHAASDILGPSFDSAMRMMNWDVVRAKINMLAVEGALDWRKNGEFEGLTGEVGGARIHKKIQQLLSLHQDA